MPGEPFFHSGVRVRATWAPANASARIAAIALVATFALAACGAVVDGTASSTAAPSATPTTPLATATSAPTVAPLATPTTLVPPTATAPPPPSATSAPPSRATSGTEVSEEANGATVQLGAGQTLTVTLHSTYWGITGSSNPQVLQQLGPATTAGASNQRIPGLGSGTVSAQFKAIAAGIADVTAQRTTCGEALRCAPDQQNFKVTIRVA